MIDLDKEQELLDQSLGIIFDSLGEELQRASSQLLPQVRPGHHSSSTWTSGFTRLTLLYPTLQTESFSRIPRHCVRSANVAHVLLLIYSFVHDRQADKQIDMTEDQRLFTELMLRWATTMLNRLPLESNASDVGRISYRTYIKSSATRYEECAADSTIEAARHIQNVAAGRAALGQVATKTLLSGFRTRRKIERKYINAYQLLVLGMQWFDDALDWREDLETGDDNLLLHTLRLRGVHRREAGDLENSYIAYKLVEGRVIEYAIQRAIRCLDKAIRRQREMNCPELAKQIDSYRAAIGKTIPRLLEDAEAVVANSITKINRRGMPELVSR